MLDYTELTVNNGTRGEEEMHSLSHSLSLSLGPLSLYPTNGSHRTKPYLSLCNACYVRYGTVRSIKIVQPSAGSSGSDARVDRPASSIFCRGILMVGDVDSKSNWKEGRGKTRIKEKEESGRRKRRTRRDETRRGRRSRERDGECSIYERYNDWVPKNTKHRRTHSQPTHSRQVMLTITTQVRKHVLSVFCLFYTTTVECIVS